MDGVSPWRKLRELGVEVPVEFAILPPIVLDRIAAHWLLGPGNDLLTHYILTLDHRDFGLYRPKHCDAFILVPELPRRKK